MSHVLIVDDEPSICWAFRECLTDEGFSVDVAGTAEQALSMADVKMPDVIVMDVRLPGIDGFQALAQFRGNSVTAPVIIMTAFGSLKTAVTAIDGGAFDYLTKPIDLDRAVAVVQQASAASESATAKNSGSARPAASREDLLVGSSPAMQEVFRRIALVAERDVPVLITGESGTGKDLVARAIHQHSHRSGSFIPVCIPALSETVVESELFGHTRGAFTGADQERCGLLELANDGSAFVDEIGDVSLNLQAKLLRVLETGELRPVGGSEARRASFRLIAATNRSLEQRVTSGEFRGDLFYRLNVFRIELPALRDRASDIPELAERFLLDAARSRQNLRLSSDALDELISRPWFGNVRELRNAIESASVVCRGDTITPDHLPRPVPSLTQITELSDQSPSTRLREAVEAWTCFHLSQSDASTHDLLEQFQKITEPSLINTVLKHFKGQRGESARLLGIHRETLREKLRRQE